MNTLKNPYTITGFIVAIIGILSLDWIPDFKYLGLIATGCGMVLIIISMFTMDKTKPKIL